MLSRRKILPILGLLLAVTLPLRAGAETAPRAVPMPPVKAPTGPWYRKWLASASTPSTPAARRTTWLYNKGAYRKSASGEWVEMGPRGRASFRETTRNTMFVALHDPNRNVHVRLYHRSVYVWSVESKKWNFTGHGRWEDPNKKPLNEDRFPDERGMLRTPSERTAFPHLGAEFEVLGPASKTYNCIAWTINVTDHWVWPGRKDQPATVSDFDTLYGQHGYRRVSGLNYQRVAGVEKIVLYGKSKADGTTEPTHGARQLSDGSWSSKLGQLPLIRHLEPTDLDGSAYGVPVALYTRPKR
jgi:hypothetical protein